LPTPPGRGENPRPAGRAEAATEIKEAFMSRFARNATLLSVALILALSPVAGAFAQDVAIDPFREVQDTTPGFMVFDALLVRPLSLFATCVGAATFVVALPVTLVTKQTRQSAEKLMKTPAEYTFTRPLGFFPEN
jgi:hypothetical protein